MPFSFGLDEETGVVIQKRNKSVLDALEIVYRQEYNIGYLQDGNEIAKPYGIDFIRYLKDALSKKGAQRVLEIGCGGCVVLESLKKDGHDVLGVDSSPFAVGQGARKNISVMTGFYPLPQLIDKFDLIFHVDVLEHINNPVEFLRAHRANLRDGGLLVVNVPDATESIDIGDISLAMHQHLNYFTEASLRATLEHAGFHVESIEKAHYGGSLYATGHLVNVEENRRQNPPELPLGFDEFLGKAKRNLTKFNELSKPLLSESNCQLGYYVPLRTLPYISAVGIDKGFRFFDDTAHWHNCVFDGVDVKIENFEDLKKTPVSHVIVMSLTFGDVIKKKLIREFGQTIRVVTLSELVVGTVP
jgi:2-polyprenyl-3-methyl-5-hydroxy-6-metoxy-1,4-benzoquinol methylase